MELTPEHTKRNTLKGLHPDVEAAYDYVTSRISTADDPVMLWWHGWALREAFLAGISFAQEDIENEFYNGGNKQ
jgi:hypothetical protein